MQRCEGIFLSRYVSMYINISKARDKILLTDNYLGGMGVSKEDKVESGNEVSLEKWKKGIILSNSVYSLPPFLEVKQQALSTTLN